MLLALGSFSDLASFIAAMVVALGIKGSKGKACSYAILVNINRTYSRVVGAALVAARRSSVFNQ